MIEVGKKQKEYIEKRWGLDATKLHLSFSRIVHLLESVNTYLYYKTVPFEMTDAVLLGKVYEQLMCEPDKFEENFYLLPETPEFKTKSKNQPLSVANQKQDWLDTQKEKAGGREIVKDEILRKAICMRFNSLNNPTIQQLIDPQHNLVFQKKIERKVCGYPLVGFIDVFSEAAAYDIIDGYHEDEITGKVMPNIIVPKGEPFFFDLKSHAYTYGETLIDSTEKAILDKKYYLQDFIYSNALAVEYGKMVRSFYIFQTNNAIMDNVVRIIPTGDEKYSRFCQKEIMVAVKKMHGFLESPWDFFRGITQRAVVATPSAFYLGKTREHYKSFEKQLSNEYKEFNIQKIDVMIENEMVKEYVKKFVKEESNDQAKLADTGRIGMETGSGNQRNDGKNKKAIDFKSTAGESNIDVNGELIGTDDHSVRMRVEAQILDTKNEVTHDTQEPKTEETKGLKEQVSGKPMVCEESEKRMEPQKTPVVYEEEDKPTESSKNGILTNDPSFSEIQLIIFKKIGQLEGYRSPEKALQCIIDKVCGPSKDVADLTFKDHQKILIEIEKMIKKQEDKKEKDARKKIETPQQTFDELDF